MVKKILLFVGIVLAFSFRSERLNIPLTAISEHRNGNSPVDFKLNAIDGRIVRLSDYRGKFVVIDCWASWCGPCREEMPATEKLINEMWDEDNLVFLFVSFDKDKDAWKSAAKELKNYGEQLIAGDQSEALKTMFNMDAIPHFIWINSKGVIVKTDAPRPSDIGTQALLKAAVHADK